MKRRSSEQLRASAARAGCTRLSVRWGGAGLSMMIALGLGFSVSFALSARALAAPLAAAVAAKLDSHILLALRKSRGEPPFDKPTTLDPDLAIEPDGRVLVDLTARVTGELLAHLESAGGKVINSFESAHAIRALVPLQRMEALAARGDIRFIAPAARATTNSSGAAQGSISKP